MGMFDDLQCKMPLPDGEPAIDFQTKDLECELFSYVIDEDGKLFRKMKDDLVPEMYTGHIDFYGYEGDPNVVNIDEVWREYRAVLIEGKVVHIEARKR